MKMQKQLIVIIATFIVGTFQLDAQTKSVVEKRIGNTVYELDTVHYIIKNKANKIQDQEVGSNFIANFDGSKQAHKVWMEHFKPLFSKERAEKLNVRILICLKSDSIGQVQEVEIHFRNRENIEKFTQDEIRAIEDTAKKYRFKVLSWDGGERGKKYFKYYYFLNPYLIYFEKQK